MLATGLVCVLKTCSHLTGYCLGKPSIDEVAPMRLDIWKMVAGHCFSGRATLPVAQMQVPSCRNVHRLCNPIQISITMIYTLEWTACSEQTMKHLPKDKMSLLVAA